MSDPKPDGKNNGPAWTFQSESADPILSVGFRYGDRTGTPPVYLASKLTRPAGGK